MSTSVALLGGEAQPPSGFGIVLGNAFAVVVHTREADLSPGVTLLGGAAIPLRVDYG